MSPRAAICHETARQVLVESGHRCAVCGVHCSLERAHIVPCSDKSDCTVENLICLCATCHQRADGELWGEAVLGEYKQHPWVLRRRALEASASVEAEEGPGGLGFGTPGAPELAGPNARERLPDSPPPDANIPAPLDLPRPGQPIEIEVYPAVTRLPDPLTD